MNLLTDNLLSGIAFSIPAIIVALLVYFMLKKYFQQEHQGKLLETALKNREQTLPMRLQAYERLTLFLERIAPESLIPRVQTQSMTCRELENALINQVNAEYTHNLTQQIYITAESWEIIKNTKGSIFKLIQTAGEQVAPEAPGMELSKKILQMWMEVENPPTNIALRNLKLEVARIFG